VIGWWRRSVFKRLARVEGFVRVLMQPRNGQPWSAADRAFLKGEMRALARWVPAFFIFLLPGGLLLLPAYAWLLDRRRGAALRLTEQGRRDAGAAAAQAVELAPAAAPTAAVDRGGDQPQPVRPAAARPFSGRASSGS
jgi:hypothetical protein